MPPSKKQIRFFNSVLKYASVSLGVGVPPAMIVAAIFDVSMEPSIRQTSGSPAPASGTTCSVPPATSFFNDRRNSFCAIGVDFSIFRAGAATGAGAAAGGFLTCSANSRNRSTWLPSADLFKITSSHNFRAFSLMSSYRGRPPGLTMDMFKPLGTAWYKKTLCIASRNAFRPRNEKDKLLRPPLKDTQGHVRLISATALMKSMA
mmetsp:Transcript_134955/g.288713  ORF Transcript_134955/g.288713 Transcript_134955/m.288713 type:complete len:204 (+) Transcript_134955:51-662(+)